MTYVSYKAYKHINPPFNPGTGTLLIICMCLFMCSLVTQFSCPPLPHLLPIPFNYYSAFGAYHSFASIKRLYYECMCAQTICLVLLRDISKWDLFFFPLNITFIIFIMLLHILQFIHFYCSTIFNNVQYSVNKYHSLYHLLLSVGIWVVSVFCYYKQCNCTWFLV